MKSIKLLFALALVATLTIAAAPERKLTIPKPIIVLEWQGRGIPNAVIKLHTGSEISVYEVQRKSGKFLAKWRTVGGFPATLSNGHSGQWTDSNIPSGSHWRVRGFGIDGRTRSPFSNEVP